MRKFMRLAAALICCVAGISPALAVESGEEPIITFHTTIYDQANVDNVFHIILGAKENTYVDVDFGYGPIEEEVGQAVYNPDTQEVEGTFISCSVSREGVVKIYGDPLMIDYVYMEGCYIDEISFPKLTELSVLNLAHNMIKSLDLSPMKKLQAVYLSDNPFDESPLVFGSDKPELAIIEMSNVDNLDPDFDITGYPNLVSLEAWHVPSLKKLDPTKCPNLMRLSVDVTGISTLDVSKNPSLLILNVSQTNMTSIDISHNPYLTEFYCANSGSLNCDTKFYSLDLTHNPELKRLFVAGNDLTTLDVSANTKLTDISAAYNCLTSLDLTNNQQLYNLNVSYNNMDFATLPAPSPTYSEYYYAQKPMKVERSYKEGTELDFSSRVLRENSLTSMKLLCMKKGALEAEEMSEDYYTYADGKLTLNKACPDSLYVAFYNTMFMDAPLNTTKFVVKTEADYGKPSPIVNIGFSTASTNVRMGVGILGATPENPVKFMVDFGDGALKEFTATSSTLPAEPNVTGRRVGNNSIIYMPEGCDLTAFSVTQGRINSFDLSAATLLGELVINGAAMKEIDLKYNNLLTYLNLDNNNLTTLDLTGSNPRLEKNILRNISVKDNMLTNVTLNDHASVYNLNLSGNKLSSLALDRTFNLKTLDISNNNLSALDLNDCESLTDLDCSHNNLMSLPVPTYCPLQTLDIRYNDVTFANLAPAGSYETYLYAPQNPVQLPTKAPSVNLKNYLFTDADNQKTTFVWRTVNGDQLVTDAQISEENGFFRFLDTTTGEVYCAMTHPAFPDFAGENVYKTTNVLAAEMPKNVFASFTTTAAGMAELSFAGKTNGTVIYIDWQGNGNLEQYILKNTYTRYTASVKAGVDVKCYSYDDDDNVTVFSVEGVKVSALDASKMKQLICFAWSNSTLGQVEFKLPESPELTELTLASNGLTQGVDCSKYPKLVLYNVSLNNIETLDVTSVPSLQLLYASVNKLKEVKLNNPKMWSLALNNNELESVDLSNVRAVTQLYLGNNKLTSINLDPLTSLKVVSVPGNYMTIATLPLPKESWSSYDYYNQRPIDAPCVDGKYVDLSSQLSREGKETTYTWYVGSPWFNDEGELVGEELYINEEYDLDNGVTTFKIDLNDLMCVMTNEWFPNLYLYTYLIDARGAEVDEIGAENGNEPVEYYDLQGVRVETPTASGIYIRRQGGKSRKIYIR